MKTISLNDAAAWLRAHDDFVILTHRRPDGDAVGCAAALCLGLRKLGKRAAILQNPEITPKLLPFWDGLSCEREGDSLLLAVDVAAEQQFSHAALHLTERVQLSIDHHGSNSGFAAANCVVPEAAACGELILQLLDCLAVAPDARMADALYLAISTDTGCFRYSNTTAQTLRAAARCVECGADAFAINQSFFMCKRWARLRLDAYLTQTMELYHGGRVAVNLLPEEALQRFGVVEDDIDNVSGFAREIEGIEIAVMIRESLPSHCGKVSVRSSPAYDAAAICAALGGGGHRAAAGASTDLSMSDAKAAVLRAIAPLFPDEG